MILKQQNQRATKTNDCNRSRLLSTRVNLKAGFAEGLHKRKLYLLMKPSALTMKLLVPIGLTLSSTILLLKQRVTSQKKIDENILRFKKKRPDLDIRFCFQNSRTKLSKAKNSISYADWCTRHGFQYCDKFIPDDWYDNRLHATQES